MKIHLRKRELTKTNQVSLYLEIYKDATHNSNGSTKYICDYEYLNLYLIDKAKNSAEKHNKYILFLAENIKSKKELAYKTNNFSFFSKHKNTIFYEYTNYIVSKNIKKSINCIDC